jgi:hypothetical protein
VSCTSDTACIAVGIFFDTNNTLMTLAEGWDGSTWTIQTAPSGGGIMNGVSCTSATACTAVGSDNSGTLAERWDGSTWTIQTTATASGATSSSMNGVSCTSATACTAVGSGNGGTLAERWDGSTWTIQTTPTPSGGGSLNGVSCTSATACIAVGSGSGWALAERWDGSTWTLQSIPNPSGATSSTLNGISCTSATACIAVGQYNINGNLTLAEVWNGSTWTIQPTPTDGCDPLGTGLNTCSMLNGVSCTSATACIAVGAGFLVDGDCANLAERWDGSSWTMQSVPDPSGSIDGCLNGVSCTSATACTTVGYYEDQTGSGFPYVTLAERWDGSTWTVQTTPNPPDPDGGGISLNAVSCTSATSCTAVGSEPYGNHVELVAEVWDGSTWTLQTPPTPSGATSRGLSGVSCTSATACTAVGHYVSGGAGVVVTLAERYSG